jgi:hypothetical protein
MPKEEGMQIAIGRRGDVWTMARQEPLEMSLEALRKSNVDLQTQVAIAIKMTLQQGGTRQGVVDFREEMVSIIHLDYFKFGPPGTE